MVLLDTPAAGPRMIEPASSEEFVAILLADALMYASNDLPVFPCHSPKKKGLCDCPKGEDCDSPGKHPRTLAGFKDASTEELAVRRWWKMWPRANVAISIPSGYVVLDVDGPEGLEALAAAGYTIPRTPTANTGKGWHYWFATETDLPPRAHMLEKVDLRGPGSYVIAPPSMHISGRQYRWDISPAECEWANAPDWLKVIASKPSTTSYEFAGHIDVPSVLNGVAEGQRDATLFRFASKLRYADVPYEAAVGLVGQAAERCTPPFGADQARKCLDSAYGRYQPSISLESGEGEATLLTTDSVRVALTGPNGPVEFVFRDMEKVSGSLDAEMTVQLLMPGMPGDTYIQRINLLSHGARDSSRRELQEIFGFDKAVWAKLLNRSFDQAQRMFLGQDRTLRLRDVPAPTRLEYIVQDLLLEDRPTIFFGAGSALKTMITMSLMLSISQGADWQGRRTQRRNCLLIDYETGDTTAGYRLRRLAHGVGIDDIPPNLYIWPANGIPLLDQVDPIRRTIERNNIGFLALDHCATACGTEPEKSDAALKVYRALNKFHLPTVAIAHITGDAAANPDSVKRPFGSIFWENGAGLTWYLRREEQSEGTTLAKVGVFQRKYNDTGRLRDFSVNVDFDGDEGPISVGLANLRDSAALLATKGKQYVIHDVLSRPMEIKEIVDATGISSGTIDQTLRRHPDMFLQAFPLGRGKPGVWQRTERHP